jgi:pimeloyl-ACP methyl ester carboxylesterase
MEPRSNMNRIADYILTRLLFQPVKLAVDYAFQFDAPFQELWFDTPDGQRLNALFFPTSAPTKRGVVLYFHGNRDNLQRWGAMHRVFTENGYDFMVPDYRGYGKSSGAPDEKYLFADALLMYNWLRADYQPDDIILFGRSLGSGMASYLAAHEAARMLILETPFDTIRGMVASHIRRTDVPIRFGQIFPNHSHVQAAKMPVLIFHGTRDRVVPYLSAIKLKECLKPGDLFITIQGGSHNNLDQYPEYREILLEWLLKREG